MIKLLSDFMTDNAQNYYMPYCHKKLFVKLKKSIIKIKNPNPITCPKSIPSDIYIKRTFFIHKFT